jgi:dTDP-4-amino-4,6-dideoxygalactose transaminase
MDAGPTISIPITRPHLPPMERFSEVVANLFASRQLSNFAKYTGLIESRAAAVLNHPAPLCVSSCDIGLTLAWRALECSAGEVIVPSFTFCSTVNDLIWNGLEPVFADVDPRTYCIDVEDALGLIAPRTVGIAAVHTFGLPAEIEPLQTLARERDLKLVFDAAHGLGGRYRDSALGAVGDPRHFTNRFVNWGKTCHGAALASIALALSERLREVKIASTYDWEHLFPWGSHPQLDPLWSNGNVVSTHDGCEATRFNNTHLEGAVV